MNDKEIMHLVYCQIENQKQFLKIMKDHKVDILSNIDRHEEKLEELLKSLMKMDEEKTERKTN